MKYTRCLHREEGKRCPKRARYFGRWAGGGLCFDHAKDCVNELHNADRARFEAEDERRKRTKDKHSKAAFVFRYFAERTHGHDADGNYHSYICEATPSYDDGMYFCEEFSIAFPGRKPDPNLILASARLSTLLRQMVRDKWLVRWTLGNEQQCHGDPKWQYCYKLPQDIINALKQGTETPESLARRWLG
jgi:hypothetical protein